MDGLPKDVWFLICLMSSLFFRLHWFSCQPLSCHLASPVASPQLCYTPAAKLFWISSHVANLHKVLPFWPAFGSSLGKVLSSLPVPPEFAPFLGLALVWLHHCVRLPTWPIYLLLKGSWHRQKSRGELSPRMVESTPHSFQRAELAAAVCGWWKCPLWTVKSLNMMLHGC